MEFEIPKSNDIEWQQEMLRMLSENLELISESHPDIDLLKSSIDIANALMEYSGC
ncbi:TPA: hypothetical protein ACUNBO_003787 [Morganella morganii]